MTDIKKVRDHLYEAGAGAENVGPQNYTEFYAAVEAQKQLFIKEE